MCDHLHSIIDVFITLKGSPESQSLPLPTPLRPWQPLTCFLSLWTLLFKVFPTNEITHCVFFGVCHVCISTSFLFMAKQCSIAWICHLFLHHAVWWTFGWLPYTVTYQRMLLSSQLPTAPDHTCDQIHVWPLLASPSPPPRSLPPPSGQHWPLGSSLCTPEALSAPLCLLVYTLPQIFPAPISTKMHVPTYHVYYKTLPPVLYSALSLQSIYHNLVLCYHGFSCLTEDGMLPSVLAITEDWFNE